MRSLGLLKESREPRVGEFLLQRDVVVEFLFRGIGNELWAVPSRFEGL